MPGYDAYDMLTATKQTHTQTQTHEQQHMVPTKQCDGIIVRNEGSSFQALLA